ncbi:MAG TPA: glycosyltransferase family 1 protein [Candidatus Rubrimentiphilum sp.]|nr:glycosyltransferase family 1 protein [Candidatus Rubrimentiphilum sp.]
MRARIALDARTTRQLSAGMQTYVRELAARLPSVAPDFEFVTFADGGNFGWAEHVRLPLAVRAAAPALTHYLSQYTPVLMPRPYVVTIHDLIHLLFPENFKVKVGPYYQIVVRGVAARAARVITDDTRTVADLQRFLGVAPERVRVVPLGVQGVFLRPAAPHRGARPYFFYSGNHREHKDLRTLFQAWEALPGEISADLLITGPDDVAARQFLRRNGEVIALGDVPVNELAGYYAGAVALVHPALREGFGLPMLEAMAAGCPVIACADALPAVLEGTALTFPARDAGEASRAMQRVLADQGLRTKLVNEGRTRAAEFTWDRCARETANVYREVLEEPTR